MSLGSDHLGRTSLGGLPAVVGRVLGDPVLVTIAGKKVEELRERSIRVTSNFGANDTAVLEANDPDGTWDARPGQTVAIYHLGEKLFGGTLESVERFPVSMRSSSPYLQVAIRAVDYNQLARRRLVTLGYERQLAGDIVRDLARYLTPEGVTLSGVEDGFEIGPLVFEDKYVADALDRVSKLTGYEWRIDENRRLCFCARDSIVAPWTVTPGDSNLRSITCTESRRGYRNVHRVRGGEDLAEIRTNRFLGDGETTSFAVDDAVGEAPTITLEPGAIEQAVGIRGLNDDDDPAFDWFWRKGENTISQNRDKPPLTDSDTLAVTYRPILPVVAEHRDQSAINERSTVEGGTGIYEAVSVEQQVEDGSLAISLAESEIRRHGQIVCELRIVTFRVGLRVGQLQRVTWPALGLDDDFLITRVSMRERGKGNWLIEYSASLSGFDGGWPEFWKRMAASNLDFGADTGRVVNPFEQVGSNFKIEDSVSGDEAGALGDWRDDPYSVAVCGLSRVGARFEDQDGIRRSLAGRVGKVSNP